MLLVVVLVLTGDKKLLFLDSLLSYTFLVFANQFVEDPLLEALLFKRLLFKALLSETLLIETLPLEASLFEDVDALLFGLIFL